MWSESIPHRFKKMKSANYKKCHRPIRRFFKCFKVQQQIFQNFVKFGKSSWKSKNRDKFYLFFCIFDRCQKQLQNIRSKNHGTSRTSALNGHWNPFCQFFGRDSSIRVGQYPFFLIPELRCDCKFFCLILMSYQLTANW